MMSGISGIRFKRCPQCGTIVLMSMAICPVCDRHFQTTAGFNYLVASASTSAASIPWSNQSPYSYAGSPISPQNFSAGPPGSFSPSSSHKEPGRLEYAPIAVSAIGLPWLGMMMNHQFSKGLVTLGLVILVALGFAVAPRNNPLIFLTVALIGLAIYVIGLLDVVAIAQRLARGEDVREWDCF